MPHSPPADPSLARRALRDTIIMALASNANILANVIRMKVIALTFGPAGVGTLGILQSIMGTVAAVSGVGIDGIGVRELAAARGRLDEARVARMRAGMLLGTVPLTIASGALVVALARPLSVATGLAGSGTLLVGVGIGVTATVLALNTRAVINGYQRIGDLAMASVVSAFTALAISLGACLLPPRLALGVIVCSVPVSLWLVHLAFLRRAPSAQRVPLKTALSAMVELARVGAPFTLGGFLPFFTDLAARSIVNHNLGLEGTGHYQAAWTLSAIYLGVLLSSLGTSLLARLSSVVDNPSRFCEEINEHTRIYLVLFGPALIAMLLFAPILIPLVYSGDFGPATTILRWQVLGDIFKLLVWTLATALPAARLGRVYLVSQVIAATVYLGALALTAGSQSLEGIGGSFALSNACTLVFLTLAAKRFFGFRWSSFTKRSAVVYSISALSIVVVPPTWRFYWPLTGVAAALTLVYALRHFRTVLQLVRQRRGGPPAPRPSNPD